MSALNPMSSLREEQQLITELVDVLKQEQAHLVVANVAVLTSVTPPKTPLGQAMTVLASQRHRALGAAGFIAGEAGMEPWITRSGGNDARALWLELLGKNRAAKGIHLVNGPL